MSGHLGRGRSGWPAGCRQPCGHLVRRRSMTTRACGRLLTTAAGLTAALALVPGCAADTPPAASRSQPDPISQSQHDQSSTLADKGHPRHSVAVRLYYARGHSDDLIAHRVRLPLREGPLLSALDLASSQPRQGQGRAVVPANSFSGAGLDGISENGAFWAEVTHLRVSRTSLGMTPDEAQLAVRAVICTIQSPGGTGPVGQQPLVVYPPGGGDPVRRLFGVQLPQAEDDRLDVACGP